MQSSHGARNHARDITAPLRFAAAFALAAMAAGAAQASANLVFNGSFEQGLAGWSDTLGGSYICQDDSIYCGATGVVSGAEDGTYYLAASQSGYRTYVRQTIHDTAGAKYRVTGWEASDGLIGFGDYGAFALAFDGVIFGTQAPVEQQGWTEYSAIVTGGGTDVITIGSRNDYYQNYFDNFSVTSVVPEPGAWALMLIGVAGLGGAARISRRRAVALPA